MEKLDSNDEAVKKQAHDEARAGAQMFWYFCILLCRELLPGEHTISPADAQILELVDEVPGTKLIKSRREYYARKEKEEEAEA